MGPLQAGVAAASGYPGVRVFPQRLCVDVYEGSELRQPGENIQAGEIYDANRFVLRGLLAKPWIEIVDLGSIVDKPSRLRAVFQTAAARADMIISAGGVSVGDEDHVVDAFQRCGGRLWICKVAIKPGKPLVLGKMADTTYIGLPGNPGALFTTFKVIIDEILAVRAGIRPVGDSECAAIANFDWKGRPGRTTYLPAVLTGEVRGLPSIELLPDANSGKLHQLSLAGGTRCRRAGTEIHQRGAQIRWRPFAEIRRCGRRAGVENERDGSPPRGPPGASIDVAVSSLRDAVPCVLAGGGRRPRRMFELVMAAQVHDLDAIGVQAFVIDQPLRQHQRLGWSDRLDVDLALQAFEAVAVGIAEILVEGDAIIVHLATPVLPASCLPAYSQASMSASRWRLRNTI